MTTPMQLGRTVAGTVSSVETMEGAGFIVRRPFPKSSFSEFDPFLLLDELGPVDLKPGEAKGAPDHPHRGFETVTYLLAGQLEHKDSQGHTGKLGPGDVQWMTAGAGVVHSEMPASDFVRTGGHLHGLQLWVNLPQRDKMIAPHYQDIAADRIPTVQTEDGLATVKVIAGEALGAKAVIETRTPIVYLHWTLQPGATIIQPIPSHYNAFAYVLDGEGRFGVDQELAGDGKMVLFASNGDTVTIANPAASHTELNVLLIAGVPLNEPIVRYGPFVMNTNAEIVQAIEDYRHGRMGTIHV
ncbi:pirin family protein [Thermocoleostomius sinensis]|jgi:redox-sensitive bicupin YhaK (pirin superfamily)|uniref:Pirin family protein n=1 Tax=Thermocoleostomius sinensis A174 TaxID=2016057 RepID=A0A9E8ZAD1_9CYAN|nr:pirin family protein [Thermocoleostomius sinensis]WAL59226.1 pirin family protein [Thermocoleostomius sinensis A174]